MRRTAGRCGPPQYGPAENTTPPAYAPTPGLLQTLTQVRGELRTLTDLGYEGEADTVVVGFKKPNNGELTDLQHTFNHAHNRLRAVGERGNSLLKGTFKALRNISLDPWRIGDIVAAALVVLHLDHARTT